MTTSNVYWGQWIWQSWRHSFLLLQKEVLLTLLSFLKHSQKEKEVKTHRRQLEKKWREELNQLDQQREQEGHGKIDLGVSHALALGPPTDDYVPGNSYE